MNHIEKSRIIILTFLHLRTDAAIVNFAKDNQKAIMKTEEIDLKTVKLLIDNVWTLKKQTQVLSQQVEKLQQERNALTHQLQEKTATYEREKRQNKTLHNTQINDLNSKNIAYINKLNTEHNTTVATLQAEHSDKINELVSSHDAQLYAVKTKLEKKNQTLEKTLSQLKKEHHAVINRIRGLAS